MIQQNFSLYNLVISESDDFVKTKRCDIRASIYTVKVGGLGWLEFVLSRRVQSSVLCIFGQ